MEKHLPTRKPSPNPHHDTSTLASRCSQDRIMVYDFLQICKTYDKNIYNREYFEATPCPACPAVGRFKMHGTYRRYAIYFEGDEIIHVLMEIKRIICVSCRTTHAVLPGDIIPYKALSLFVFIFILILFYSRKIPVLEIAKERGLSFQFIYSVMRAFQMHMNNIRQYLREVSPEDIPAVFDACGILDLIKKPYIKFQSGYIGINRRPCFMCKFFERGGAPPIGIHAPRGATT
jgi:hypothetical protein